MNICKEICIVAGPLHSVRANSVLMSFSGNPKVHCGSSHIFSTHIPKRMEVRKVGETPGVIVKYALKTRGVFTWDEKDYNMVLEL